MAQTTAVLVAIVMLAVQAVSVPQPTPTLDNVDLMDIVIKPAYDDLQRALATAPADRQAWAALYQRAARLAEFENLLFIRPRATSERGSEWSERAGQGQKASAAADGCNACHRAFSREAPTIRESAAPLDR